MNKIDKLLPIADFAVKNSELLINKNEIKSKDESAISGFGASVINLGINHVLKVYADKHENILKALNQIVPEEFHNENITEKWKQRLKKEKYMDASVALKLIVRTYKIVENED